MSRKLPARIERAVADTNARKLALADEFERALRGAVSEVKTAIMCKAGCHQCCYYPVYISVLEAIPLYRHLCNGGKWTGAFRKNLRAHQDTTLGLAPEVWMLSLTACPLLDDKKLCMGYPARPLTCRATYSTGDPLRCHPHQTPNIIPKVGVLGEFATEEAKAYKAGGAHLVVLPISMALLLAEGVCAGDPEFEAMDRWVYRALEAKR